MLFAVAGFALAIWGLVKVCRTLASLRADEHYDEPIIYRMDDFADPEEVTKPSVHQSDAELAAEYWSQRGSA